MDITIDVESWRILTHKDGIELYFNTPRRKYHFLLIAILAQRFDNFDPDDTDSGLLARHFVTYDELAEHLKQIASVSSSEYTTPSNPKERTFLDMRRRMNPCNEAEDRLFQVLASDGTRVVKIPDTLNGNLVEATGGQHNPKFRIGKHITVKEVRGLTLRDKRDCTQIIPHDVPRTGGITVADTPYNAVKEVFLAFPTVTEVTFTAYFGKMLVEALRLISPNFHIGHLRALFRDMKSINCGDVGEVPRSNDWLEKRRLYSEDALKDLQLLANHTIDEIQVRFHRNQPCIRAMLLRINDDEQYAAGIFSLYRHRQPTSIIDYSARSSPTLVIYRGEDIANALLDNISGWFEFVWQYASYDK